MSHQSGSKGVQPDVNVNSLKDQDDVAKEGETEMETNESNQDINPLQMPLILGKIHSLLDADSIKIARQVNGLWSAEGAKALLNKCYVKSPWEILLHKPSRKNKKKFRALLAHTSRSTLMVPNITIADAHDVELWKSFGVLGKHVTSLKLKFLDEEADDDWLCNLLDLLPNLKYLNLKNIKKKNKFSTKILISVMSKAEMAPNRNPLIISPMSLKPTSLQELEVIEQLRDCKNIKTDELNISLGSLSLQEIPNLENRLAIIMNKLLSTNQNILKKLSMERCEQILSLLEFPCMTKLNQVKLFFRERTLGHLNQCQFSPGFVFSEKIPNLQHISVLCKETRCNLLIEDFLGNLFATTGKASSVKRLSYSGGYSNFPIEPLFQVFPNVEDFQVLGSPCTRELLQEIWIHGVNLKKLHLYINVNQLWGSFDLDSRFTGFNPETIDKIKKAQKSGFCTSLEDLEILRVNPSILNLNRLEYLSIRLSGPWQKGLSENFLAITGEYALQLMAQEPKISICAKCGELEDLEKALAQVSKVPNVSVVLKKPSHARKLQNIIEGL